MKILFVESGEGVGGSVVSLYYLIRGLRGRGVEPVVSFPSPHAWSEKFAALGAEVIHERPASTAPGPGPAGGSSAPWTDTAAWRTLSFYRSHISGHAAATRAGRGRLAAIAPDLVYLNNELPLNFSVADAARSLHLPVIAHLRGVKPLRLPHRRFAPYLSAGIAISDFVRAHYLAAGFPPAKIHRVHNGIDVADYPFRTPRPEIPSDEGRILFLGRLAGWKGADTLLDAAARLRAARPKLTVTVAGDGPARGAIEERARALGLADVVRFTGFVADTVTLLHGADVLVHTSTEPEPFGRVLLEGMAAGVPVVASDLGATREILDDGDTGFLCPAGDAGRLAAILETLLGRVDRAALARRARQSVEDRFTTEKMVDGVLHHIEAAVGDRDRLATGNRP